MPTSRIGVSSTGWDAKARWLVPRIWRLGDGPLCVTARSDGGGATGDADDRVGDLGGLMVDHEARNASAAHWASVAVALDEVEVAGCQGIRRQVLGICLGGVQSAGCSCGALLGRPGWTVPINSAEFPTIPHLKPTEVGINEGGVEANQGIA